MSCPLNSDHIVHGNNGDDDEQGKYNISIDNNQQDPLLDDPYLKLKPVVTLYRLPVHLVHSHLPASFLDEIHSTLESKYNLQLMNKRKESKSEEVIKCDYKKCIESFFDEDPRVNDCLNNKDSITAQNRKSDPNVEMAEPIRNFMSISSEDESVPPTSLESTDTPSSVRIDYLSGTASETIPIYPKYQLTLLPWLKPEPSAESENVHSMDSGSIVTSITPMSPDHHYSSYPFITLPENSKFDETSITDCEISELGQSDFDQPSHQDPEYQRLDVPFNWLDVSKVTFQPTLIVEAIGDNGRLIDGRKFKSIFKSVYDAFGKYHYEINFIKSERFNIKLYFDNHQSRAKIKCELEEIIMKKKLKYELLVRTPNLVNPCISFVARVYIDRRNQWEWIEIIKKLNSWPEDSSVTWKCTTYTKKGWYRVKIFVDSRIRTMIEKANGFILVERRTKVMVIDELKIIQCYRCFEYGHGKFSCKKAYRKCFFCGRRLHIGICPLRRKPEQWFCGFCKVKGHSACSRECPVLLRFLKPELEKINHQYKFVFLERDIGRELCNENPSRKKVINRKVDRRSNWSKSPPKRKYLVDSLVDDKLIDPYSYEQIYHKFRDNLGSV